MLPAGAHILVYPFPTSGHIIPLLDLTNRLLTLGLNVTVLITQNNLPLLDSLNANHPSTSLQSLVLPQPKWPAGSPATRLLKFMRGLRELHYPALLDWFKSHPSPPVAILSDFFLGWTQGLAAELGLPRVVFSPSGAFALSVSFAMWTDLPTNDDPDNVDALVSFPRVPNCPVYPWYQISHLYRTRKEGDPDWDLYRSNMMANKASWGIVFNSFAELERVYIDHLMKEMGHNRVWAVGPALPPEDDLVESMCRGGSSSVPAHDVLTWLDSRRDESVVYVCFGSRYVLTAKQIHELAAALEKTDVDFVYCVREPDERHASQDCGVLPDGFEDRVAGRGYVIRGWSQQVAILRHKAVGAFLTHCGWNSVLEGVSAGVVMMTWPMDADQFTNAQLLVDQLGVGIRVGEGTRNIPESGELARLLAQSMDGTRRERLKARELSGAALSAVVKGGSSDKDLNDFIKRINELKSGKNLTAV